MNVLVLTGGRTYHLAEVVLAGARLRGPEHSWRLLVAGEGADAELAAAAPKTDLLISFLNPLIVPPEQLRQVGGRAYNVHPGTPDYPGTDPMHFAFYEGNFVAGATLHLMEEKVDAGPICAVVEQEVDPDIGLPAFSALCVNLAANLLLDKLPLLLRDELKPDGRRWDGSRRRTHRDFLKMCRIPADVSRDELERRIGAFYHPGLPERPFVELHGHRFVYEAGPGAGGDAQEEPV